MRNKNLLILLIVVVVVAAVAAVALLMPKDTPAPPAADSGMELTAPGYVYISAGTEGRWFELPEEDNTVTLRRTLEDGTEMINEVLLTPNSVCMASSTCENQDCVDQGVVSFENKEDRVLMNFIICLPNQVTIELYTRDEMQAMLAAAAAQSSTETETE